MAGLGFGPGSLAPELMYLITVQSMSCSLPGRQGEGAWHVWNICYMPDLVLGISQRWFLWILSNGRMAILWAKELSPLQRYCLGGGQKRLVPLAELKPVSAGSAKFMPACHRFCPFFPTPPGPVQLYTPTPAQIPKPAAGVPLPSLLTCCSYDRIGSLFVEAFCLHLEYVTCFYLSSVVTSEPALFYCCISAQNKWLRYFYNCGIW